MVVMVNITAPEVGIRHTELNTTAFYSDRLIGKGTLYVSESVLSWIGTDGQGFALQYENISAHAISRTISPIYSLPQIYLMLNIKLDDEEEEKNTTESDEDEEEDEDEVTREMCFMPDNSNSIGAIFQAIKQCQVLNPSPEALEIQRELAEEDDCDNEEEEEEDYYAGGDTGEIIDTGGEMDNEAMFEDAEGDDAIGYVADPTGNQNNHGDGHTSNSNATSEDFFNGQDEQMEVGQFEDADA